MSQTAIDGPTRIVIGVADDRLVAGRGDGRQLRRERNVRRVLDAAAGLLEERRTLDIDDVVARSGTSCRSVHRYFGNVDRLIAEVADRRFSQAHALVARSASARRASPEPEPSTVRGLVQRRVRGWALVAPILGEAGRLPEIREQFVALDRQFRAAELPILNDLVGVAADRRARLAAVGVVLRFDSIDSLVRDEGIARDDLADVLVAAVSRLVAA